MLDGTTGRALLVVSACVVLAAGVGGLDRAATPLTQETLTVWPLQGAGVAVAIAALVGAFLYRRRNSQKGVGGDPIASSIAATILTLVMFGMLAVLPAIMGTGGISRPGAPPPEQPAAPGSDRTAIDPPLPSLGGEVTANPQARPEQLIGVMPGLPDTSDPDRPGAEMTLFRMAALVLASIVLGIILFQALKQAMELKKPSRGFGVDTPTDPPAAREIGEALERSVIELSHDAPRPRGQITGAYHRLLSVLREAGYPRRPEEAPHEHLQRALVELGVAPDPMRRLTELYVFAEFGRGRVRTDHRRAAAEALEESLGSLRARYPALGASRPAPAEAG